MKVGQRQAATARHFPLPAGIVVAAVAGAAPLLGWALAREEWLVLALLMLVAATPIVIRWPVISTFGLYAFLVPFDFVTTAPTGGATLTKVVGMIAAAALLSAALLERRLVRPPWAALLWALFMVWAAVSAAWAITPSLVFSGLNTALSLFLLYLVAVSVRVSEKEFAWVCALTVLGGTIAAGWSALYGLEDAYDSSGRVALVVGEHAAALNTFAPSLIPALALAIGGFIGLRSPLGRALSVVAVGVISSAIYLTMSRGALVGLAVMAAVFLYRIGMRSRLLLVLCLLIGVSATMPQAFFDRILAVFGGPDATGAGRTEIWAVGIDALSSYGLVGAGFSNFMEAYGRRVPIPPARAARGSHNDYLGTWVELGIVGLAFLIGALVCHLLAARRVRGTDDATTIATRATEAACFGVMMVLFFAENLWTKYFWLSWILLIWGVRVSTDSARQSKTAERDQAYA